MASTRWRVADWWPLGTYSSPRGLCGPLWRFLPVPPAGGIVVREDGRRGETVGGAPEGAVGGAHLCPLFGGGWRALARRPSVTFGCFRLLLTVSPPSADQVLWWGMV